MDQTICCVMFHELHYLWYQSMVSVYGISLWYQAMVSVYGISLWYQSMVSVYGISKGTSLTCYIYLQIQ